MSVIPFAKRDPICTAGKSAAKVEKYLKEK